VNFIKAKNEAMLPYYRSKYVKYTYYFNQSKWMAELGFSDIISELDAKDVVDFFNKTAMKSL